MKNLFVALLAIVAVAACGKKEAAVDTEAVKAEIQAVVAAEFTSADAFLATLDQAATVTLADGAAVTVDSLRKLSAVTFGVTVDSVAVGEAATTAYTSLSWTGVVGADTVTVTVGGGSAAYTKGEAGWAKN